MTDTATPVGPRWIDYVDIDELVPDERNPKGHNDGGLDDSLERFGYTESVMVDERTGKLVAGHGRREMVLRRRTEAKPAPDGVVVAEDGRWLVPVERGWSSSDDHEALAYLIASNRHVEEGGWVHDALVSALDTLSNTELSFTGIGYTQEQFDELLHAHDLPDNEGNPNSGDLLARSDVTVGEPKHTVLPGEIWRLDQHVLVCADLMREHTIWKPYLGDDVLFCPYPGPFIALGSKIETEHIKLLMVQPDTYIAGHILDKWTAIHGDKNVKQVA